jgi:hypothetical protein
VADEHHVAPDAAADAHILLARLALAALSPDADELDVRAAATDCEAHLAAATAVAEADRWLAWRWRARIAIVRGRLRARLGDRAGAQAEVDAVRAVLGTTPARLELDAAARLAAEIGTTFGP